MKICLISEGSYPIVRGGVSEWTQQLIKGLHFVDFDANVHHLRNPQPHGRAQPIAVRRPWQRVEFARYTMAPDSG